MAHRKQGRKGHPLSQPGPLNVHWRSKRDAEAHGPQTHVTYRPGPFTYPISNCTSVNNSLYWNLCYITGVATVSCLDPDWHSVSVLQGPFSVYGMEGILTREIKGMHMLHTPGHPLEMHSPAGLSKCYTSRDQPQGRAKVGSAGSSQKPFFLQPVTNQNMCNRV